MKKSSIIFLCLFNSVLSFATTYYSTGSVAPNTLTNWKTSRDGTGTSPTNFTTSGDIFIIQGTGNGGTSPHSMTTSSTWTLGANVTLKIENGGTLTATSDITINATGGTFQMDAGSTYIVANSNQTKIVQGTESWAAGSTVIIQNSGIMSTSNISGGAYQNLTFSGGSTTVNASSTVSAINGNLTINNSNGKIFRFAGNTGNVTVTIGGNLILQNGTLDLSNGSGIPTINLGGDFTMSGGTLSNSGGTTASINFTKTGTATLTKSSGTISNAINFTVNSGCALEMGTSILDGSTGTFTLSSGAGIRTAHTAGIAASGATGSIQVTGTRTFNAGANYEYIGTANQNVGSGFPDNLTGTLTINNTGSPNKTVTLDNARTIANGGSVVLTSGTFAAGTNLTLSTTSSISRSGGDMTGTLQGSGTYNVTYTGANKTTGNELGGSGFNNLTINMTSGQTVTLGGSKTIPGTLTLTSGNISLGTNTLTATTISGGSSSSFVVTDGAGTLKISNLTTERTFPVGPTTSSYSPIKITNGGDADNFSVNASATFTNSVNDATKLVNIQWGITRDGTTPISLTLKPYWKSSDHASAFSTSSNVVLGHYTGSAWTETAAGTVSGSGTAGDPYSVTVSGITSLSPFGIGNEGGFLNSGTPDVALSDNGTQPAAGNIAQATTSNLLATYKLQVTTAGTTLNQVTFPNSGTYTSGDLTNLKLWYNSSNNGPGSGASTLSTISNPSYNTTQTFGSLTQYIAAAATGYFWVTADVAGGGTVGNTITAGSMSTSNFTFAATVNFSGTSSAAGTQTISAGTSGITLNRISDVGGATILVNTTNNIIYNFKLDVASVAATLTQVTVPNSGTYDGSDFTNLKLWYNSSNNGPGSGASTISTLTTPSNTSPQTFGSLSQSIAIGATGYFWVTADVASGATDGHTITVTPALAQSNFTFGGSTSFSTGTINAGGTQTISAVPDVAIGNNPGGQVTAGNIAQAATNQILANFTLAVTTAGTQVTQVTFANSGTYASGDFTNFKLWYNTTNTFGTASTIKTISSPSNTSPQTFATLTQSIAKDVTGYFWITADVSGGSTTGHTITVSALTSGNFSFTPSVNFSGTMSAPGEQTISAGTSNVTLSEISPISAGDISLGSTNNVIYNFKLEVASVSTTVTQVDIPNSGTYDGDDLTNLKLWYNSTNAFGSASTIKTISSPSNTSPQSFTALSQAIAYGATGYFWVTADVAGGATAGNTITVTPALATSNITLSGTISWSTGTISAGGTQTIVASSNASDYFRSKQTGNWGDASTWQSSANNSDWINATLSPNNDATAITVRNGHTITVAASVAADDLIIDNGGQVTVNSTYTFTVNNGAAATDITVNGYLKNSGTITISASAAMVVGGTGTYEHNVDAAMPTSSAITWNTGSTCLITGIVSSVINGALSNLAGTFSNLTYNCTNFQGSSNYVSLGDNSITINGKLLVQSTGAGNLLTSAATTTTLTVGSYEQTGGTVFINRNSGSTRGLSVTGDMVVSGGTIHIKTLGSAGAGALSVSGNLTATGSTITNSGTAGSAGITFAGTNNQSVAFGTLSGTINFTLNNTGTSPNNTVTLNSALTASGMTLTAGQLVLNGNTLTIPTGTTITRSGGSLSGTPTFAGTVNVTYTNTGAINTGSEIPASGSALTNLSTAGGSAAVTLNSDATVNGTLTISGGNLTVGSTKTLVLPVGSSFSLSSGKTFTVDGTVNSALTTLTTSGATMNVNGTYIHSFAGAGTIPTANWASGSTCEVRGVTSSVPAAIGQSFYNFIWNCSGQSQAVGLAAACSSATGTFEIAHTAGFELRLMSTQSNAMNYGSINLSSSNAKLVLASSSGTPTVTVTGNVNIASGATLYGGSTGICTLAVGGNWSNAGTFTPSASSGSCIVRFNGSTAQSITNSNGETFAGLTIANSANSTVTLMNNVTVSGELKLTSGLLTLGSSNLTLSGTLSGTPSIVNMIVPEGSGELRKVFTGNGTFNFPIGDNTGTAEYTPVSFTLNSNSGLSSAYVAVKLSNSKHPNNTATTHYIDRYWTVTSSGITSPNYSAYLYYMDADIHGTETSLYGGKRTTGDTWLGLGSVDADNNRVQALNLTSFSEFSAMEATALPVELTAFIFQANGRNIELTWNTATEVNSSLFAVERSTDKLSWFRVGSVDASGYSNSPKEYSFTDKMLNTGKYSYRLKMIDMDGTFEYSPVIEAEVSVPAEFAVSQNYPNPFNPSTKINYDIPEDSRIVLSLYGITGEKVAELVNGEVPAGYYTHQVDMGGYNLSSGIYFYKLVGSSLNGERKYNVVRKMMYLR